MPPVTRAPNTKVTMKTIIMFLLSLGLSDFGVTRGEGLSFIGLGFELASSEPFLVTGSGPVTLSLGLEGKSFLMFRLSTFSSLPFRSFFKAMPITGSVFLILATTAGSMASAFKPESTKA